MNGLEFLDAYYENRELYLPLVDHAAKYFPGRDPKYDDVNIGWNCGLVDERRPYFMECWATDGITILTFFIACAGLESHTMGEIDDMMEAANLYRKLPGTRRAAIKTFTDSTGESFFSINVIVGDENEVYIGSSIGCLPFSLLNRYNKYDIPAENS